jgi:hypothetical protein
VHHLGIAKVGAIRELQQVSALPQAAVVHNVKLQRLVVTASQDQLTPTVLRLVSIGVDYVSIREGLGVCINSLKRPTLERATPDFQRQGVSNRRATIALNLYGNHVGGDGCFYPSRSPGRSLPGNQPQEYEQPSTGPVHVGKMITLTPIGPPIYPIKYSIGRLIGFCYGDTLKPSPAPIGSFSAKNAGKLVGFGVTLGRHLTAPGSGCRSRPSGTTRAEIRGAGQLCLMRLVGHLQD